eukprot:COSAG04_NODE_3281_length_2977_cov_1.344336_1_plen_240_part_00
MGKKGQRARQRKRLAKLGDEQRRAALRQRQEESQQPAEQRPAEEAELIRAYHTLEKRLAAVATDPVLKTEAEREARRAALRAEQAALGGLDAYQRASLGGESSEQFAQFSASEWVLEELGGKPLTATHKSAQRTEPLALPAGADSPGAPPLRLLLRGLLRRASRGGGARRRAALRGGLARGAVELLLQLPRQLDVVGAAGARVEGGHLRKRNNIRSALCQSSLAHPQYWLPARWWLTRR